MSVTLDVICPAGLGEGDAVQVEHLGTTYQVAVPPGVSEGFGFQVEVSAPPEMPEPSDPEDILSMSDDDEDGWYYGGPDPEAGAAARAVLQQAVQGSRLKPHEASALRRIMAAVNTFTALDELVRTHAPLFAEYTPDGEQRLEWTTIHHQYVELVEARISFELDQLNATNDDLFALLAAVSGQDAHADSFLARMLTLNDFHFFCAQMGLGGGTLAGSVDDAV